MGIRQFKKKFKGASITSEDIMLQENEIIGRLVNKYYNLFCSSHIIEGEGVKDNDSLKRYIYRRFWKDGTICFFKIGNTGKLGACQYAPYEYNMYNDAEKVDCVYLTPSKQVIPLVPQGHMTVNKDVVLGWYQRNHKSVYKTVRSYCEQLADIEMAINTNLQVNKIPYMYNSKDKQTAESLKNVIQSIMNNETAIPVVEGETEDISVSNSSAPFIIDKLYTYKCDLENELKTYLGLNNSGTYQKASHTLEAEVESTQQDVNDMQDNVDDELNELSKRVKTTLGLDITFKRREIPNDQQVDHMDKDKMNGEAYQNDNV